MAAPRANHEFTISAKTVRSAATFLSLSSPMRVVCHIFYVKVLSVRIASLAVPSLSKSRRCVALLIASYQS